MKDVLKPDAFFDLKDSQHRDLFAETVHVWDALKKLKGYMDGWKYAGLDQVRAGIPLDRPMIFVDGECLDGTDLVIEYGDVGRGGLKVYKEGSLLEGASVVMAGAVVMGREIHLGEGVLIESGAMVKSPAIIGDCSEIRQGAYLRGYTLVGRRCVVGHVTEVKHSVFLDDAKAGHFAYLGDSILGNKVNLGAGTKMANLRFMKGDVLVKTPDGTISTGLRKMGAILGDETQTGCNSVTNPGTVLGRKSMVFPNTTVPSGYHGNSSLIR